jgi:hypothetical protein
MSRWGDSAGDLAALDAWITREPDNDEGDNDCLAGLDFVPDEGPCGECLACRARAEEIANDHEEPTL